MKKDLVVFGMDWGRHPNGTQHITQRLAKEREVIWVNSIGMRRPKFNCYDISRASKKLSAYMYQQEKSSKDEDMAIIDPLTFPFPGNPIASFVNGRLLSRQVRNVMKAKGVSRPILMTALAPAIDVFGKLGESGRVYFCRDDYTLLPGVANKAIARIEKRLIEQVDLIIVSSEQLQERFPTEKTYFVTQGVDANLFGNPQPRPVDLPSSGPVAGFYGPFAEWINYELIIAAAKALQDWHFFCLSVCV